MDSSPMTKSDDIMAVMGKPIPIKDLDKTQAL